MLAVGLDVYDGHLGVARFGRVELDAKWARLKRQLVALEAPPQRRLAQRLGPKHRALDLRDEGARHRRDRRRLRRGRGRLRRRPEALARRGLARPRVEQVLRHVGEGPARSPAAVAVSAALVAVAAALALSRLAGDNIADDGVDVEADVLEADGVVIVEFKRVVVTEHALDDAAAGVVAVVALVEAAEGPHGREFRPRGAALLRRRRKLGWRTEGGRAAPAVVHLLRQVDFVDFDRVDPARVLELRRRQRHQRQTRRRRQSERPLRRRPLG
mmetsp:Transcript_17457/g.58958  ORF Transcript_17457/g.58958 Transcript_17457/m.58958 type:complete len:271 (-) Transcript_17457:192-1004(-)